jgi:hypothetical protein
MDLMHDLYPQIAGSAWAIRVLGGGLVLAGLPLASIGVMLSALTTRRGIKWPSWCFSIFQIGFVIQVCSVAVTIMLWFVLRPFAPPRLPSGTAWESLLPLIGAGDPATLVRWTRAAARQHSAKHKARTSAAK